jgi:hypothetical protein
VAYILTGEYYVGQTANKGGISQQAVSYFQIMEKGVVFKSVARAILVILLMDGT